MKKKQSKTRLKNMRERETLEQDESVRSGHLRVVEGKLQFIYVTKRKEGLALKKKEGWGTYEASTRVRTESIIMRNMNL